MLGVKVEHYLLSNFFSFIFTFTQCKLIISNISLLSYLLNYLLTYLQSSDVNASSNTSPLLAALEIKSSKLDASRGLFLSSPSAELLLNSLLS